MSTAAALAEVVIKMARTDLPDVLSRDEAAERFGISPRTFSRRLSEGKIPLRPVTWAKRPKFRRVDVDRVLGRRPA